MSAYSSPFQRVMSDALPPKRGWVKRARPAVLQHQRHVLQRERAGAAQFVGPVQAPLADHDFALAQDPVGTEAAAGLAVVDPHPGHEQRPVVGAAHVELGADHLERLEARLAGHDGPPRQGGRHRRQRQQLAPLPVVQRHVAQEQARVQALPGGVDAGNRHLVAQRAAGGALDVALVIVDVRQHRVAQEQEQHRERKIHQQGQLDGEAQQVVRGDVGVAVGRTQPAPARGERQVVRAGRLRFRIVHQGADKEARRS
jgi:hypothetical protein